MRWIALSVLSVGQSWPEFYVMDPVNTSMLRIEPVKDFVLRHLPTTLHWQSLVHDWFL